MALYRLSLTALLLLQLGLPLMGGCETQTPPILNCPAYAGVPGSPGHNGLPGRDGRDGREGAAGILGNARLITSLQSEVQSLAARLSLIEKAASFRIFRKVGQKYYVSDGLVASFDEGLKFCNDAGGTVVLPRSEEENQALSKVVAVIAPSSHVFIGATDMKTEGQFVDVDVHPLTFTKWRSGEPNNVGEEDCSVIRPDGLWADVNCNENWAIVCEMMN